jgi:hypothetical protein
VDGDEDEGSESCRIKNDGRNGSWVGEVVMGRIASGFDTIQHPYCD